MTYDYKRDFPIFQHTDVAYIDNAATAQRPQCVLDAVADFYRCHNANPLRGLYPLSVEATDIYEQARETVRDFIGARSAREIVFTRNTTESLNLVAYSYGLTHVKAGDEVLVSIMEHHSDLLPWQMVCRQTGAELKFIECAPDGSVDLQQIESLITERTKIVAMTQVSNVLGRKYPLKEVAAMAHKKGAVMVVDGAQSTPHIPVDVQALDADFFAFSGHKVYGPKITMNMANDEGWTSKNGSKWKTMPDVMIQYRAASFFGRMNCPDMIMGIYSQEEVLDMGELPTDGFALVVDPATGEVTEAEKDEPITQDQRQTLFKMATSAFGQEANGVLKSLLAAEGYESTEGLPTSVYHRITEKVMEMAQEKKPEPEAPQEASDTVPASDQPDFPGKE